MTGAPAARILAEITRILAADADGVMRADADLENLLMAAAFEHAGPPELRPVPCGVRPLAVRCGPSDG